MSASNRPDPLEPTMVHPPAKGPPSRGKRPVDVSGPRVGFVEGTRPRFADETAGLLRTRLQAAALVVSILLFLAFAANLLAEDVPLLGGRALVLAAWIASFFALRSRREFSPVQLRCFEVGLFGALAVQILWMFYARTRGSGPWRSCCPRRACRISWSSGSAASPIGPKTVSRMGPMRLLVPE